MTNSQHSPTADDFSRFERLGVDAEAKSVARAREELGRWLLDGFDLDSIRLNDVVLSVYEALANCAEFAYLLAGRPGTVDLTAVHDRPASTLTLTIADTGSWREADPSARSKTRGRGIPLMQALADHADIDCSAHGTTVSLVFNDVAAMVSRDTEVPSR